MAVLAVAVYGLAFGGWASNNKYSLLGGLRSSAQLISYELSLGLSILTVLMLTAGHPDETGGTVMARRITAVRGSRTKESPTAVSWAASSAGSGRSLRGKAMATTRVDHAFVQWAGRERSTKAKSPGWRPRP